MGKSKLETKSRSAYRKTFWYWVVKYVVGKNVAEELMTYTNKCPILWATVGCIIGGIIYIPLKFFFVTLFHFIVSAIEKIEDYVEEKLRVKFENSLKPRHITEDRLYEAWKYKMYHTNSLVWFGKRIKDRHFYNQIYDIKYPVKGDDGLNEKFSDRYVKEQAAIIEEMEKRKAMMKDIKNTFTIKIPKKEKTENEKEAARKLIASMIMFGKSVVGIIISIFLTCLSLLVVELFVMLGMLIIDAWNTAAILSVIGIILKWVGITVGVLAVATGIGYALYLMFRNVQIKIKWNWWFKVLKVLAIIAFPFSLIGKLFVLIYKFFAFTVVGTKKAFSGYFRKEYSGFCHGVEWED